MEESSTVPLYRGKKGNIFFAFSLLALLLIFTFFFCQCKVVIVIDGGEAKKYFTFCNTVEELLKKKKLEGNVHDDVKPGKKNKIQDGDLIEINRAKPVFLVQGGKNEQVWTNAGTVGDFLREKNIYLHKPDSVFSALTKPLYPYDEIKIIGLEEKCFIEKEPIPFSTIRINNPRLEPGVVKVVQNGCEGARENVIGLIVQNGSVIYNEIISSRVVTSPVNRILEYGDNTAVSRGGRTFNYIKELEVIATAYCPGTPGSGCPLNEQGTAYCTGFYNDGFTFTGEKAVAGNGSPEKPHIIAVDPDCIPLKSLVYIEGYGFARAEDTGGAIKNNRIDLLFDKHEEALQFGRKNVKVYLIKDDQEPG
jgi:3D (Asp-Asp-Asp) domain-containing protein